MEAQTIYEKVGKTKGEEKCRQFIILYICYNKYRNVLDGIGQKGKPTFFPLLAGE